MTLYLLGGRPCSGKTTLAYHLGQRHQLKVWYLDVFMQQCIESASLETPYLYEWKTTDMIDILQKNPSDLFEDYVHLYEEMFPLLIKELEKAEEDLILEGSILMPKFINILKEQFEVKICYIVTDDTFVKERYVKRDYAEEMVQNPKGKKALDNLLARDSLFANYIEREVEKYGFTKREINAKTDVGHELKELAEFFDLKH